MPELPDLSLVSQKTRDFYELGLEEPDNFTWDRRKYDARILVEETKKAVKNLVWHRGFIKKGYGADEDGLCFISWLNYTPLTVVAKPMTFASPGTPNAQHVFRYSLGGHMSGCAETLAGAITSAMIEALHIGGQRDSDSEWLRNKNGFFEFHQVDPTKDDKLKLADFMRPEYMTPLSPMDVPSDPESQISSPRM